jgi:hypothetical protein
MKPLWNHLTAALALVAAAHLQAANFSSGSDGSLGALNVTDDTTIDLPANGRLNYTTVTVAQGKTLRFKRNALNTPVYLLASGDVIVSGTIDVSGAQAPNTHSGDAPVGGLGGPGGFDGGKPGFSAEIGPGSGYGPGGARGGLDDVSANGAGGGSFGTLTRWSQGQNNHGTVLYGSPLLIPMIGGSGGGGSAGNPGFGGGGGGGAILIASSTSITITGTIYARGGQNISSSVNAGSGGAVRLLAPAIHGNGTVDVYGNGGDGSAGAGRIRADAIDRSDLRLNFAPRELSTVGADMFVFPPKVARLDIIEAAGTTIPIDHSCSSWSSPSWTKERAENVTQSVRSRVWPQIGSYVLSNVDSCLPEHDLSLAVCRSGPNDDWNVLRLGISFDRSDKFTMFGGKASPTVK